MTQLRQNLPDDLMKRFYATIYQVKGMKKGNVKAALIEAIEDWIKKNQ